MHRHWGVSVASGKRERGPNFVHVTSGDDQAALLAVRVELADLKFLNFESLKV